MPRTYGAILFYRRKGLYIFISCTADLEKYLANIYQLKFFAVDVETTGLDVHQNDLLLIQIGNSEIQYLIDARKVSTQKLSPLLSHQDKLKILVNAKFDYKFLKKQGLEIEYPIYDCMIIERLLNAGIIPPQHHHRFSMNAMAKRYLNKDVAKETRETFISHTGDFTEKQLEYAAKDIIYTYEIFLRQKEKIQEKGIKEVARLENMAVPAYGDIEYNGFYLDKDSWLDVLNKRQSELSFYQDKLSQMLLPAKRDIFGQCAVKLSSPHQILEALNKLGYNIPDTSDKNILELPEEIREPLSGYRKAEKAISSFGMRYINLINPITNRLHANINQLGAATGRNSFDNPPLQQVKRANEYRSCFKAQSKDGMLICNDYSGEELRIITEMSGEQKWAEILNNDGDLHSFIGSSLFGKEVSKKINPHLRTIAKNLIFALVYGAGVYKVMMFFKQAGLECTKEQAEETLNKFFGLYPSMKKTLDSIAERALRDGVSYSLGNRPRFFNLNKITNTPDGLRIKSAYQREATNHRVQGTGADILKRSLILLRDRIKQESLNLKIVHIVHDEIVCESIGDHDYHQRVMEEVMLKGEGHYLKNVLPAIDGGITKVWEK